MTADTDKSPAPDPIAAAGPQWLAQTMPTMRSHFDACKWVVGTAPSLHSIEAIDLCGLQLLVVLRRRTQADLGQCTFQNVPDCIREGAQTAGLLHWLGIEQECSA